MGIAIDILNWGRDFQADKQASALWSNLIHPTILGN